MTEEIKGQIRHALTTLGGVAATLGWVNNSYIEPIIGVAMIAIGFIWSYVAKK